MVSAKSKRPEGEAPTTPIPPRTGPLTPGDSVRIARELQEMTQADLADTSGIPQPTISSIERGRTKLGAERAEKLARALKCHPALLLWPQWEPSGAPETE